jgi:diguanylate cyclase (GGDEF)-like protein
VEQQMTSAQWIVVLEATADGSTPQVDEATLSRLLEGVSDYGPIALLSDDRYAVQLRVTAANPYEAAGVALRRWSGAVFSLGAPAWNIVRADVMTLEEFTLEFDMEERRGPYGAAPSKSDRRDIASTPATARHGLVGAGSQLESEIRWRLILAGSRQRVILLSAEGAVLFSQPPLEPGLVLHQDGTPAALADIAHPDDADIVRDSVTELAAGEVDTTQFVTRLPGEDGWHAYEASARNLLDEPLVGAIVVNLDDVTREKELEQRLARLTRHDDLTGLVNRAVFLDHLELALGRSLGRSHTAVFFVDIDDFRGFVQRAGDKVGEQVLMTVADRIRTGVRQDAMAARLGRDEFALLCENIAGSTEVGQIAKHMAELLSEPLVIDGEAFSVPVSIGVALTSAGRAQPATMLRHAELAMQRARRGRARYEIFRGRRRSPTGSDLT